MTQKELSKFSDKDLKSIHKEYVKRGLDKNATVFDVYSTFTPAQKQLTENLVSKAVDNSDVMIDFGVMTSLTETQKRVMCFIIGDILIQQEEDNEQTD